jgi:ABC-type uncharacterized transport system involved in gliding motility auxiliary subunit
MDDAISRIENELSLYPATELEKEHYAFEQDLKDVVSMAKQSQKDREFLKQIADYIKNTNAFDEYSEIEGIYDDIIEYLEQKSPKKKVPNGQQSPHLQGE